MGIPNESRQVASNAIAARGNWISLHTGVGGGTNGANETTGGGYQRRQTAWTPGTTGVNTGTTVNSPCAAGTYTEGGVWSAQAGGSFVGSGAFTSAVIVSGSGASVDITPSITV